MNEELKKLFDWFNTNMDKRFDNIDNQLTKVNEKLDCMIDKKEKDNKENNLLVQDIIKNTTRP